MFYNLYMNLEYKDKYLKYKKKYFQLKQQFGGSSRVVETDEESVAREKRVTQENLQREEENPNLLTFLAETKSSIINI